ncbi:MAG: ATP-grasp domain-containing protein, partial [Chloroflexota bacterium]|nr:ATP-grasp domain-containing protein [Chloroflexota bacterium]
RSRFRGLTCLAIPETEILDVALDKQETLSLAASLGVPIARSMLLDRTSDIDAALRQLGSPIVLKSRRSLPWRPRAAELPPRRSRNRRSVRYAKDALEAKAHVARMDLRDGILAQEFIQGPGVGVEIVAVEGVPILVFQHRRLREFPPYGGMSTLRESVPVDPELARYAISLLSALRWTGLAMIEFKSSPEGPRLLEINGRAWGSLPLAVHSGADFPTVLAESLLGPPAPKRAPARSARIGVRSRNLQLDVLWLAWVLAGRRRFPYLPTPSRLSLPSVVIGFLDPRIGLDSFSRDDPGPALLDITQCLRMGARLVRRLLTGRR